LRGSSDAAQMPYHVERSKLFVMERLGEIAALWMQQEFRGPSSSLDSQYLKQTTRMTKKVRSARAANLIGQLGDPHYLRKANALYHEFDEVGMNKKLGYPSPADLMDFTSTILLQQHFSIPSNSYPIFECYIERTHVDRKPL
jgi:hypothetical protein